MSNGIFDLISCFVAVILHWGVTLRRRAVAHHRCRHGVGAAKCLCGGADAGFNSFYAACGCGKEYRCGALPGETLSDMLGAMARIDPSQPNEAMARIAPRSQMTPMVNIFTRSNLDSLD
jgi:hypothetical protein